MNPPVCVYVDFLQNRDNFPEQNAQLIQRTSTFHLTKVSQRPQLDNDRTARFPTGFSRHHLAYFTSLLSG
jgi:hypothetical protein